MSSRLDVPTFVARWQRSTLTERRAAQQHVFALCASRRLDHAVLDVDGWPRDLSDEEILGRLLALNCDCASGFDFSRPPDFAADIHE